MDEMPGKLVRREMWEDSPTKIVITVKRETSALAQIVLAAGLVSMFCFAVYIIAIGFWEEDGRRITYAVIEWFNSLQTGAADLAKELVTMTSI